MAEYRFQLTPLTPIHVGTGESLEPFEYVIAGDTLYRFTLDDFLLALDRDDQARFVQVVERSVPATRRFVAEHVDVAVRVARFTATVSPAARALYDGRMEGGVAHPEVFACIRTGDLPYVPGSSLKGALRTALLYHAMDKDNPERNARRLEQAVFGFRTVQQDPFRAFKVGDGNPLEEPTRVRTVIVNTQRAGRWSEDVAVLVETVPGVLSDSVDVEVASRHAVTFDADFYRYHERAFRLNPSVVLVACRDFYGTHLAAERDYTRDLAPAAAAYDTLVTHAESLPDHACLVRLAWGSGRDATTVAYGLRDGRSPASRRLTADGFPLGWAELAVFDAEGQPVAVEETLPAVGAPPERAIRDTRPRGLRDLRAGMVLEGTVKRTVNYGAFVDVGVGRDGLIHISKLTDGFVERVEAIVRSGDRVRVQILDVDIERRRISLKLVEVLH
ncbi:MAG: type III-A CRISPR-associated RAMP protein Csm5 [Dehalococcoidia bacterium]|nr:MAG: type III-A CRISPR-associated RAMP protein Csm5 [Dehalococcoidia bacterium]